jgi:hypothetical protein
MNTSITDINPKKGIRRGITKLNLSTKVEILSPEILTQHQKKKDSGIGRELKGWLSMSAPKKKRGRKSREGDWEQKD